jgi:hypothetical protein
MNTTKPHFRHLLFRTGSASRVARATTSNGWEIATMKILVGRDLAAGAFNWLLRHVVSVLGENARGTPRTSRRCHMNAREVCYRDCVGWHVRKICKMRSRTR